MNREGPPFIGCSAGGMNQESPIPSREILTEYELEEAKKWMGDLVEVAKKSTCTRSKRGVIIVKYGKIIGKGSNKPHDGFEDYCHPCMRTQLHVPHKTRYELCSGEHAERAALDDAIDNMVRADEAIQYKFHPWKARMYHVALDDSGNPIASGDPSCTLCSGAILKSGITNIVLWHGGDNYEAYNARTFHELSLKNMIKYSGLARLPER
jgi:deoxycytidylate deaminase